MKNEYLVIVCGAILCYYGVFNIYKDNIDMALVELTLAIILAKVFNLKYELNKQDVA